MVYGTIIRGVGGNYYVDSENGLIECRARGLFRNQNIKPLVGDKVYFRITEEDEKSGFIEKIEKRKNEMKRPPVSNVDQILIVFAATNPEPSFLLLDMLLVASEMNNLEPIICFNKIDLIDKEFIDKYKKIYESIGYKIVFTSADKKVHLEEVVSVLKDKTTLFSGPSGVGKSSLMNAVETNFKLKTGTVSEKLKRGKHTTRHAEIYKLSFGGFVVDTPGFSSFDINEVNYEDLTKYYPEILKYSEDCKFRNCAHVKEPGCAVKEALNDGFISNLRYDNYLRLLEELKSKKQY